MAGTSPAMPIAFSVRLSGVEPHWKPGANHVILGLPNGKFAEVEDRRCKHRRGVAFANAGDHVVEITDPAGGNDRYWNAICHGLGQRNVETLTGAIPVHGRKQ